MGRWSTTGSAAPSSNGNGQNGHSQGGLGEIAGEIIGRSDAQHTKKLPDYDPQQWYLVSHDAGMRDRVKFNWSSVPPALHAIALKLVENPETPYRTLSDLLRDAMYHRIHQVESFIHEPEYEEKRKIAESFAALDTMCREADFLAQQVQQAEKGCRSAVENGDKDLLHALLEELEKMASSIREPYAGQLRSIAKAYSSQIYTFPRPNPPEPPNRI